MKRGTASRVFFGVDKTNEDFGGLLLLSQVTLGKKSGMFDEHKGLCIVDNVLLGKGIARVISVIIRGTSPLTLPDAIVDSLSYVKAFGGTRQGLPDGYTQLEYIESSGTQYIDTGVLGTNVTAFELKGTIAANGGQNTQFIGGTNQAATSFFGARASSVITWYCMTAQGSSIGNPSHVCVITSTIESASSQPGTLYDTVTGTTTEYAKFASVTWGFGEENILLFGGSGTRRSPNATCYYLKLYTANGLAFYGIPVKNSSNAVGLYDVVSGTFFTNAGTGEFIAGPEAVPTPDAPMDIVSNNGVLKYGVIGKNLFDPTKVLFGYYRDRTTGVKTASPNNWMSSDDGYIPCLPNTTYTFVGTKKTDGTYSKYNTIYFFDSVKNYLGASPYEISQPTTGTTPNNCYYLQVRSNPLDNSIPIQDAFAQFNWQLEQGSTVTAYEPYQEGIYTDGTVETIEDTIGNTAIAEMLLKVGDYQDVQSIIDGVVTRKVGVKVLDGTEGWTQSAATNNLFYATISNSSTDNTYIPISSHFQGVVASTGYATMTNGQFKHGSGTNSWYFKNTDCANATAFSQYLADQYAAGTPVIIVYPLATPTTESVTGQTLQVQAGDNTLEITQASLDNLELEAQYQASVSLTIQEVQDANLDPNVEVTIN